MTSPSVVRRPVPNSSWIKSLKWNGFLLSLQRKSKQSAQTLCLSVPPYVGMFIQWRGWGTMVPWGIEGACTITFWLDTKIVRHLILRKGKKKSPPLSVIFRYPCVCPSQISFSSRHYFHRRYEHGVCRGWAMLCNTNSKTKPINALLCQGKPIAELLMISLIIIGRKYPLSRYILLQTKVSTNFLVREFEIALKQSLVVVMYL